jgi:hypothetical protein
LLCLLYICLVIQIALAKNVIKKKTVDGATVQKPK